MTNSYQKVKQKLSQNKVKTGIYATLIIAAFLFVGLYLGPTLGWWAFTPGSADEPAAPTSYVLLPHDYLESSNTNMDDDTLTFAWYGVDATALTESEIEDLQFTDFTLESADEDNFTPDANHIYILKATGTDVVPQYFCTDSRIFEGHLSVLSLGDNDIYMMNETEDVSMLCYSNEELTSTINQTDDRSWSCMLHSLDASESATANCTADEGYLPYFDPETNEHMSVILEFQFNVTTASTSYVSFLSSYDYRKTATGSYVYIEVDVVLYSEIILDFKFSSVLGSTYEAIGIVVSYGYDTSNTNWDTQN